MLLTSHTVSCIPLKSSMLLIVTYVTIPQRFQMKIQPASSGSNSKQTKRRAPSRPLCFLRMRLACCFLGLFFNLLNVPSKRVSKTIHVVTSHKTSFFLITAARASNPTSRSNYIPISRYETYQTHDQSLKE